MIKRLSIAAILASLVSPAFAAVLILEGTVPPESATPPLAPSESPPAAAAPSASGQPPATAPVTPPVLISPTAPTITAPAPRASTAAPDSPRTAHDTLETAPPNSAELSIEMLPGQTVSIGSTVSFKVSSKKPGYLVLLDVDATGHVSQIYPNTASLARTSRTNANYVKAGSVFTVPLPGDPYAGGVRFVVSPPNGHAMIVGVLSASPVQILDLPDVPAELIDKPSQVLSFLSKKTAELRIPDDGNQMHNAKWSIDARPYVIQ
jgi:hypothetical protein